MLSRNPTISLLSFWVFSLLFTLLSEEGEDEAHICLLRFKHGEQPDGKQPKKSALVDVCVGADILLGECEGAQASSILF